MASRSRVSMRVYSTDNPTEQKGIADQITEQERKGRPVTDDWLSEMIRLGKSAGQTTETQEDLFGSQQMQRSLIPEKAEISAYALQQMKRDAKLFSFVSKGSRPQELSRAGNIIEVEKSRALSTEASQALEVYNKLSSRSGPIDDILNEAAHNLAGGGNAAAIKADAYSKIREEISRTLTGGTEGRSPTS